MAKRGRISDIEKAQKEAIKEEARREKLRERYRIEAEERERVEMERAEARAQNAPTPAAPTTTATPAASPAAVQTASPAPTTTATPAASPAAVQTASPAPSSSGIAPLIVLAIALINYAIHWNSGFEITFFIALVDVITLVLFVYLAGFGWKTSFLPFALQLIIPGILLLAPGVALLRTAISSFISIILVIPWWFILAFLYEFKLHPESKTIKWATVIVALIALFFLIPSVAPAFTTTDYTVNQELISNVKDFVSIQVGDKARFYVEEAKISLCTMGTKTKPECEKQIRPEDEQFAASLKIDDSLETSFAMDVPRQSIKSGDMLYENKITSYITAKNSKETAKIDFACGLQQRGGKPKPESLDAAKGIDIEDSVDCEIDISKPANLDFYFNATANDVSSAGYREFIIVRNPESGKVNVDADPQLKSFVTEVKKTSSLNPKVGKNDLLQPIVHIGERSLNIKPTDVFGVESGKEIEFALYLKNTGNGLVNEIKSINFNIDNDFAFDIANCGATAEKLNEAAAKLRTLRKGQITATPILSCKLVAKGASYSNLGEKRTASVDMIYDYTIAKKTAVLIR